MTITVLFLTIGLLGILLAGYRFGMSPGLLAVLFGAGPIVMIIQAGQLDLQLFTWVKIFTLAVSMAVLVARRSATGLWATWLSRTIVGILALNILEAVVADVASGAWWNAVAGGLLVATQRGTPAVGTRQLNGRVAVTYDLPWSWLLAYTAWNLAVVCAHYPPRWVDHMAVLAAPLVAVLWARDRRCWLEARAFTLGVFGNAAVLVLDVARWPWIPTTPMPSRALPVITCLALALGTWNALAWWRDRRSARGVRAP
jgi:hypothetical protein